MKKRTQKEMCLEVLKENFNCWLPAHYFVGERDGINGMVFLSYKAPARLSELYNEHTGLDREKVTGKTGTKFYRYKLRLF